MPGRRDAIALTPGEQDALLAEARILQVASINPDGTPHLVPMWFERDGDLIVFTTYRTSQKVRNLERDPRLTVLVEAGEAYEELRGMSIDAEAEVVREPRTTAYVLGLIGAKYRGSERPAAPPASGADLPPAASKRVTVRVHPRRVRSWDHRKLGG